MPKQVAKKLPVKIVRRKAAGAAYHHGDLRESLKAAALDVLASPNAHLLSFRDLARKLGVTTGAPYFHFKDRTDLLVQIAIEGFLRLHQELERASADAASDEDLVQSLTVAYLDFARREHGYYQAMFHPEVSAVEEDVDLRDAADSSFRLVCRVIAKIRRELSHAEVTGRAVSLWSLLHGIINLRASGILARRLSLENENRFAVEAIERLLLINQDGYGTS